jgi:hypothetical protein
MYGCDGCDNDKRNATRDGAILDTLGCDEKRNKRGKMGKVGKRRMGVTMYNNS